MADFIRKNLLVCTVTFMDEDGTSIQPSAAVLFVNYRNMLGVQANDTVTMNYDDVTNSWSATWDSSRCTHGNVEWMVFGSGALQAATQGQFQIAANAANTE